MNFLLNKKAFFVFLSLGLLLRLVFLQAGLEHFTVNGDESMGFLQAREIASGNFPLLFWTQPYQFPIEAYLMAPIHHLLPWSTFGVRLVPIVICLVAFGIFLILTSKLGTFREVWPGYLLLIVPSAYSLARQTLLFTPQHSVTFLFCALCPLLIWYSQRSDKEKLFCFLAGAAAGLAISNHLLVVSLVVMTTLAVCCYKSLGASISRTARYSFGFILGLAPYLYAKLTMPGAYQKVADTRTLSEGLSRVWDPAITEIVPMVLGINTVLYPDAGRQVSTFESFVPAFSVLFVAFLLALVALRAIAFIRRVAEQRWPSFELIDVFLGTTILATFLLTLTKMTLYPRYGLLIVWFFPFLLLHAYSRLTGVGKKVVGASALTLLAVNVVNQQQVYAYWTQPDFSHEYAFMPKLRPLYKYFDKHNITHCYAGFWLAYQIDVDSQERIKCSPPFNDRFLGWSQPFYKKLVDQQHNTPFVVGKYQHRWLETRNIIPALKENRLYASNKRVGQFQVINLQGHQDVERSFTVSLKNCTASSSAGNLKLKSLIDNDFRTSWQSERTQSKGDTIEIELTEQKQIHGIRLFSEYKNFEKAIPKLHITAVRDDGQETVITKDAYGLLYPVKLDRTYPRYSFDGTELFLGFKPVAMKALRLKISTAKRNFLWRMSEIQLFSDRA